MHEIYCLNNGGSVGFYEALAIADDGNVLAAHLCSQERYMAHDLGMTSSWKHENYNEHFGEGNWVLVWIDDPANDERIKNALELNKKLGDEAREKEVKERTYVKIDFSE
jgi:hypothetical protein